MSSSRTLLLTLLAATPLLAASPAMAKLYRCELPGGKTVFTDNPAKCPKAEEHEPGGNIQSVPTVGAIPTASTPMPSPGASPLAEQAAADSETKWRQKRQQKEAELAELEQRRAYLEQFVTHCNRGGDVFTKDDAGMKREISCTRVRDERDKISEEVATVRAYLDTGIYEECRRAGCLPGWLR